MTHKSFETPELEPVTFDIDGERFTCLPVMPARIFQRHMEAFVVGGITTASPAVEAFLRDAMEESEAERFFKFIDDPNRKVDAKVYSGVVDWLAGHYSDRPTEAPSPSGRGQEASEDGSTAT